MNKPKRFPAVKGSKAAEASLREQIKRSSKPVPSTPPDVLRYFDPDGKEYLLCAACARARRKKGLILEVDDYVDVPCQNCGQGP